MEKNRRGKQFSITIYPILIGLLWTIVLASLFLWTLTNEKKQIREVATYQARAFFQEIVTTRFWNARHGGVYVPVTEETKPNPYLDVPDRDVLTVDGVRLTKINPAYMTRQIGEIASERNLVWFHITSTNPIRPANSPDIWEAAVLESFSSGLDEYAEFIRSTDGAGIFRYMAPLLTEKPCLKCHARQGYKEGDLRGGISVSIQADPILASHHSLMLNLSLAYFIIWALGLLAIGFVRHRLKKEEKAREEVIFRLEKALAEVKTLSGFIPICSSCKNIRNDKGYWEQIERYVSKRSEAKFSHGICPDCMKKLYPEYVEKK